MHHNCKFVMKECAGASMRQGNKWGYAGAMISRVMSGDVQEL